MDIEGPHIATLSPIKHSLNPNRSATKFLVRKASKISEDEDSFIGLSIASRGRLDQTGNNLGVASPLRKQGSINSKRGSAQKLKPMHTRILDDSVADIEPSKVDGKTALPKQTANPMPIMIKAGYTNALGHRPKNFNLDLKSAMDVNVKEHRVKESYLHTPKGAVQEIDLLYFPSHIYSDPLDKKLFT